MNLITTDISPDNLSTSPAQYDPHSTVEDATYNDANHSFLADLHWDSNDTFHTFKKNPDLVYRKVKCLYLIISLSTYLIIRQQLTYIKTRSQRALQKVNGIVHFLFIKRSLLLSSSPAMAWTVSSSIW